MSEKLAFSLALDLMFNGQDMDYCERPISLTILDQMAMFSDLPKRAHVAVVAAGGGRLVRTLAERGYNVDAFEGRHECFDHLERVFLNSRSVRVMPARHLEDPTRREKLSYDAMFCMDDLRAFREDQEWTEHVQGMVRDDGYFVYSQMSNQLPTKKNTLNRYFDLSGNYNVSEDTSQMVRDSYMGLAEWEPDETQKRTALEALDMVKSGRLLRRSIRDGVEVRYVVWRKKPKPKRQKKQGSTTSKIWPAD
ncbi:methyltransferase domain-containing protein [Kordiimonas aestuarii]|uniref:hypothetical protein n=1 Tax=Kordiimonas aestuarii TaxID=1005925 RepID=UPI0021D2FBBE|nr:hypothetical protein [Kordiimonas aestuarii]